MVWSPTVIFALLFTCKQSTQPAREAAPETTYGSARLRRLTTSQYQNSLRDIFGEQVDLTAGTEAVDPVDGLIAVGAGLTALSPYGVDQYETAARTIAAQVLSDSLRDHYLSCTPSGTEDASCASDFLATWGRMLWRRRLTDTELTTLTDLAGSTAELDGDFYSGLSVALTVLLQSPYFIYRVELGKPACAGECRQLTDMELASRLSFFLWNTTPADVLLTLAEDGGLSSDEDLYETVSDMIDDPRTREGLLAFFEDMLMLRDLDDTRIDTETFPDWTEAVLESAREQTLRDIEFIFYEDDAPYSALLTSRVTHIDSYLADIYGIDRVRVDGFEAVTLPEDGARQGLLGQVSFLTSMSHPTVTSPTLRGQFVREVLLCQVIASPPVGTDTFLPAEARAASTARERLQMHAKDPCVGCHSLTDPIGLGLENFDAIGRWRDTENDVIIDASGELDEAPFEGPGSLIDALVEHDNFDACLTQTLYRFATGHVEEDDEHELIDWLDEGSALEGRRLLPLMRDIATSPGFRTMGTFDEEG